MADKEGTLSAQEQNFVSQTIALANELYALRNRIKTHLALFNQKSYLVKLEDSLLGTYFNDLTNEELINGVTALQIATDALGDDISGQTVNLIKLGYGR